MLSNMLSKSFIALTLSTLALAAPEPQTPSQTTAYEAAILSYAEAIATDPAILSLATKYATDTAAMSSLAKWEASLSSVVAAHETPAANFLDGLPKDFQSFYGSVLTAELSIASQYGFTSAVTGSATPTKTPNAAAPTKALGAAAALGAGVLGVMIAL